MRIDTKTCVRVAVAVVLVGAMVWSGLFIRDRLAGSQVEKILSRIEDRKGMIDPSTETELRDLGDRAVPVLAERLKQGRFGGGALQAALLAVGGPAVGALADALDYDKPEVRLFAAEILGNIQGERKMIVRALVGALGDKALDVRAAAARSLGNLRVDARDATTALLETLDDPEATVRQAVVRAIGDVATDEPDVIKALVGALSDADAQVRRGAVDKLAGFGTPDAAIPTLVKLLADEAQHPDVRRACACAFRDIAPRGDQAIPALRKAADGGEAELAKSAIEALGKHEAERTETTAVLIGALSNADGDVRAAAAESLGKFGEEARAGTDALLKSLADAQWSVRQAAAVALGKVAAPKSAAPAALVKMLGDKDNHVRQAAVLALMDLGTPNEAIGPIVEILDSDAEDAHLRWACAHALSRVGKRGGPAVGALKKAMKHSDERLSKQAAEALANIQAGAAAP